MQRQEMQICSVETESSSSHITEPGFDHPFKHGVASVGKQPERKFKLDFPWVDDKTPKSDPIGVEMQAFGRNCFSSRESQAACHLGEFGRQALSEPYEMLTDRQSFPNLSDSLEGQISRTVQSQTIIVKNFGNERT